MAQEVDYYKDMSKKCQMKIDMVMEVLKTGDEAEMKLKMIE